MFYHKCSVCNAKKTTYLSIEDGLGVSLKNHGFPYGLKDFETLSFKTYQCDNCNASDRDRLYKLFIEKYISDKKKITLLEFAPAEPLKKWIETQKKITYRSADLFMKNVDDTVDIMDMNIYKDNSFDMFICSHILEHVEDDDKAIRELKRILNETGVGILMAPIITVPGAFDEDINEDDIDERWRRFAQDDHLRIYDKKTYKDKMLKAGFYVNEVGYKQLGLTNFLRNGIDLKSVLYVVSKRK